MNLYEEKYNEILEWARKNKARLNGVPIEEVLPELAESEDERMVKAITHVLYENYTDAAVIEGVEIAEIVTWLEKQKEQKPELPKPHKGDDTNPYDMSVSEAQEYAIKRGFGVPFNDGEVYVDERHITQTIGNILRWADEHPKEQKPWKVGANAYFTPEQKPVDLSDMMVHKEPYIAPVPTPMVADEQKPAEWNEEDKSFYDSIVCEVIKEGMHPTPEQAKWFKSLPERFNLQSKPEWSEEDENALKYLHELISFGYTEKFFDAQTATDMRGWLNTRLKFLRPRPHWKPSEEQMEALLNTLHPDDPYYHDLKSLYEQLKKLM